MMRLLAALVLMIMLVGCLAPRMRVVNGVIEAKNYTPAQVYTTVMFIPCGGGVCPIFPTNNIPAKYEVVLSEGITCSVTPLEYERLAVGDRWKCEVAQ